MGIYHPKANQRNSELVNVVATLKLRGMKVLRNGKHMIHIDYPSADFKRQCVEITEHIGGKRSHCCVVKFSGFRVRWEQK